MNNHARILVVDDDISYLEQMPDILDGYGEVDCFHTIDQGIAAIHSRFYDVAILDLNFSGEQRTGLDIYRRIVAADRGVDVIMVTAETDYKRIFELVNAGIRRFVPKLDPISTLREQVESVLADRALAREATLRSAIDAGAGALIGNSSAMTLLREQINRIVESGTRDILIQGETGTGKEVVARYLAGQADKSCRFLPLNCGGLNESLIQSELFGHVRGAFTGAEREKKGIFESAGGGFVFLDEIGDMPLSQQPKLLRALQERTIQRVGEVEERQVNFRTISATHICLRTAVEQKQFREDLFFRISKEVIFIPPLRDRIDDLKDLAVHFISRQSKKCTISGDALRLMSSFDWPGNVRQLESVIDAMAIRCDGVIRPSDVLRAVPELAMLSSNQIVKATVGNFGVQLVSQERLKFQRAIIAAEGDKERAAKMLGLSRASFYRKAKELNLVRGYKHQGMAVDPQPLS